MRCKRTYVLNNVCNKIIFYHGIKLVMSPKMHMVTLEAQIAVLRPNLSETRPAQKEPRAKPRV